jgi:hypothetical protein
MTPEPIQAVLDPSAARMLFASLVYPTGAPAELIIEVREGALRWLAELAPRDRAQSALAVRVIASHHALMHHLAQAAQGELADDLVLRHSGRALTAARMMDRAMEALQGRQVMAPLRAVALPGQIAMAMAEGVPVMTETVAPLEEAVAVVEVAGDAGPPDAPVATLADVPPAAPVAATGYVAKRLQDLADKEARGEELTAAQKEWRGRHVPAGTGASAMALAA